MNEGRGEDKVGKTIDGDEDDAIKGKGEDTSGEEEGEKERKKRETAN